MNQKRSTTLDADGWPRRGEEGPAVTQNSVR